MLNALWGVMASATLPATTSECSIRTEPEKRFPPTTKQGNRLSQNSSVATIDATENPDPCEVFVRGLANRSDLARRNIVCTLCEELYGWKSLDQPSDKLMAKLLSLCHDNATILSKMLETPFMDSQTPVQWVFARLPDEFFSGTTVMKTTPPIVNALLLASSSPTLATKSLVQACCDRDGDALYQLFNERRFFGHSNSSYRVLRPVAASNTQGSDQATRSKSEYTHFEIPHFPERMLLDGYVDLRFVHEHILWSIRFETTSMNSKWKARVSMAQLSSTLDSDPAWKSANSHIKITVFIKEAGAGYSRQIHRLRVPKTVGSYGNVPIDGEEISKLVSDDRKLTGQVHISGLDKRNPVKTLTPPA